MPYAGWASFTAGVRKKSDYLKSSTFLFCASAPKEAAEPFQNLYMWGHYGSGHSGIAIEYDANVVAASVYEHQTGIYPTWPKDLKLWTPVFYRDEIARITAKAVYEFLKAPREREMETELAAHFNTISRTKATVWQPEHEWRLMWRNDKTDAKFYKVPLLDEAIRRVFIGLRMGDEQAKEIAAECKTAFPNAEILKGAARPGEFALDFYPIS
jgi:hypothetical protein